MIMRKSSFNLFSSVSTKKNTFLSIKNHDKWLKRTFIRTMVVSILLITVLTIKILNFQQPKKALAFVESKLEFDANMKFYSVQAKKLSGRISTFGNKAITAIKIEDRLNKSFISPINGEITTYFNESIGERSNISKGLIFTANTGEDIYCVDEGVVIDVGSNKSIGNYIVIKHKGELLSAYKYMGTNHVDINQRVEQGQIIGTSSEKLLLEVWYRNRPIDPMKYINTSTQRL